MDEEIPEWLYVLLPSFPSWNHPWVTTTLTQEAGGAFNCTPGLTHLCLCDWLHRYYHSQQRRRICSARFNWQRVRVHGRVSSIDPQKKPLRWMNWEQRPACNHLSGTSPFLQVETVQVCLYETIKSTRFIAGINLGRWKIKKLLTAGNRNRLSLSWLAGRGGLCHRWKRTDADGWSTLFLLFHRYVLPEFCYTGICLSFPDSAAP